MLVDIRLWPLAQESPPFHDVIDGLGNIGRMIAHALEVLGAEQEMNAERQREDAWIGQSPQQMPKRAHPLPDDRRRRSA
jgi:hypothetical protein